MGANVSTSQSIITNKINQEIDQSARASATTTCEITIGNVNLQNSGGCRVRNENKCVASSQAALDAISTAAADAWSTASTEQKTSLIPGFNVSATNQEVKNEISNILRQKCQSDSLVTQRVAQGDLNLQGCQDVEVINLNTGNAQADCGIKTVVDTVTKAAGEIKTTQSTGDIFGDIANALQSAGIFSVICCICCCCILLLLGGGYMFFMGGFGGSSAPTPVPVSYGTASPSMLSTAN